MVDKLPSYESLVEQLGSPDLQTQIAAVRMLGRLDDPRAGELLMAIFAMALEEVEALGPQTPITAEQASGGLDGAIEAPHIPDPTIADLYALFNVVSEVLEQTAPAPLTIIRPEPPSVRTQILAELGNLDDPGAVERLLSILRSVGSVDKQLFNAACEALAQLAHTRLAALIEALKSEKHFIALEHLVEVLSQTRDPQVVEPLFRVDRGLFLHRDVMCRDEDFVADEVNTALRQIGSPAVDFLITMLRDPDATVRYRAARDLTIMKDPRAIAPLLERLQDPSEDVRRAAIFAFRLVWDEHVVDPLIALLRDPSSDIREEAVRALGRIGDPRTLEPLMKALHDRNMRVRDAAVGALRKGGDPRVVAALIPMLRSRHREIRISTISVLGQIKDERAVAPLIKMLRDRDYGVREWAVGSLGWFVKEPRVVESLIQVLRDPDDSVRESAARILRDDVNTPEAQAALQAFERGEIKPISRWRFWLRLF